jgi:hypothetical protein
MTRNPEILEVLDNWTEKEIRDRIWELQEAQRLRKEWEAMSRLEKDVAWHNAH